MRLADTYIVAVGKVVFHDEEKFKILHHTRSGSWTLQIRDVEPEDAGAYECQIGIRPKKSMIIRLNVIGKYC